MTDLLVVGDRTKHLKNLHGIHKSQDLAVNGHVSDLLSQEHTSVTKQQMEEKSVLSSHSGSTSSSVVSSMDLDPPNSITDSLLGKFDPLDVSLVGETGGASLLPARLLSCNLPQETVSMSLDDVLQYAQPIADYTF